MNTTYVVKSPVKYGGKLCPVGAVIEMLPAHAQRALAKGSVELHSPREQTRAINEAIQRAAARIAAGELSLDQAVEQIASQASGSVATSLRQALQDSVEELRARKAETEERAIEQAADAGATRIAAGASSLEAEADAICAQIPSARRAEVEILLQQKVAQLKPAAAKKNEEKKKK